MAGTQPGTAVIIVRKDGSFLLVKRAKPEPPDGFGRWSVPGGRVERGETWQECGIREALEESGLKVTSPDLLAVTTVQGLTTGWLTVWMMCSYEDGDVVLNDEGSEYAWVQVHQLGSYALWDACWTPLLHDVDLGELKVAVEWAAGRD
jgi:8-oxo-dGTP diphosphatase